MSTLRARRSTMLARMRPQEFTNERERGAQTDPTMASMLAAISLLTDPDPVVVQACERQILQWGTRVRSHLEAAAFDSEPLRSKAGAMLRSLDLAEWCGEVASYASEVSAEGRMSWQQLERGALLISRMGRRDQIDVEEVGDVLDTYADELRPRFEGKSAMTCARLLAGYLNSQLGYGGSRSSYYEVSNIHFDQVLNVRRGVPVALTLIYILVGRRAGLDVTGVAIPDHFLVRVHGARPVLLDPYHEGRQVTKADCIRYLRIAGYSLHTTSYLEVVPDRQLLDCMLRNLLRVYGYREDNEHCLVLERARRTLVT